jgi:hypothetical protein
MFLLRTTQASCVILRKKKLQPSLIPKSANYFREDLFVCACMVYLTLLSIHTVYVLLSYHKQYQRDRCANF